MRPVWVCVAHSPRSAQLKLGEALNALSLRAADAAQLIARAGKDPGGSDNPSVQAPGGPADLPAVLGLRQTRALVAAFRPRPAGGPGGSAKGIGVRGASAVSSSTGGSGGDPATAPAAEG